VFTKLGGLFAKYMARSRKPPSQTWRTLLENHVKTMVSVDFFTVPTIRIQVLYVFLVLAHDRRRILHFAVMAHPTAQWTAQPLREAFPWDSAPRFWLRDRDRIFGSGFPEQVEEFGMEEVLGAPGVPQPRAYIERVIGTIRRECLDHVIVFNEASLCRHLKSFLGVLLRNLRRAPQHCLQEVCHSREARADHGHRSGVLRKQQQQQRHGQGAAD
jgi:transposase InsO family protein